MSNRSMTKRRFNSVHHNFWGILLVLGAITSVTPVLAQSTLVAREISISSHSSSASVSTLLRQGKTAYEAGNYTKATATWQKAYQQYQAEGNLINQALSLSYLSLSSQKQGNWQAAKEYIAQSLDILESEPKLKAKNLAIYAQVINTQGRLQLATGKIEAAIVSWKQAAEAYQKAGDDIGTLGSQINQAQALQSLGLYRRSQKLLIEIASQLQEKPDSRLKISGLRTLGIALQVSGNLNDAQEILQESLAISEKLNLPEESSATLLSLGDTVRASGDLPKGEAQSDRNKRRNSDNTPAYAFYEQAAAITSQPLLKVEAQLNQLSTLIAFEQWRAAKNLVPEIQTNISQLSNRANRRSIYAQINLANSLIDLAAQDSVNPTYLNQSQNLLTKAVEQAEQLQDIKAESYGLGILGHLSEQRQQWSLGQKYTEQAIDLAQRINEPELIYQWQWQLGRLQVAQNNYSSGISPEARRRAIASYSEAVNALESLRSDLALTNLDVQYSFRDGVEPVYRELVRLLLQPENNQAISQANLIRARDTIESLQLAELNDFFREACLDATPISIENVDPEAAVIYPIILRDRLEVILSLPGKPLQHYSTPISQTELEAEIQELRETVVIRSQRTFRKPAQNLYDWLIRPTLQDLVASEIKTLVFVPDGSFRNIPMGVLHDKENYLIEKYNIALTPGLQLLAPRPLKELELKTLAAGLTEERQGFAPLDYVQVELEDIQKQLDSTLLIDQEFTREKLQNTMESQSYPIVHIATHGQFSSILEDTFLLAWDSRIQINQLSSILQNRNLPEQQAIELLVLSACETAVGDDRAALGLAGMAVRAGARSTLATLWSVNDQATALAINNFYQQLTKPTVPMTKTEALREAQLTLINLPRFNHPYYWSSFILIGNWL
ncbi:MAG: CHAT domain-containing protein [Xenococcaceae cyanobacterium MO_188.B19]|nr:CHAT domain-containing protein [Xenococcaceae cyanobacterium MO_188.B19]